uniref:Uncharacterized protein n=1 Tax=Arundo donax TaxID=35708 RepID=A0A0A9GU37_ARUDO
MACVPSRLHTCYDYDCITLAPTWP